MGHTSVQHYGSTLAFSIVRSDFLNMNSTLPTQTIVRTFNKFSANLSQCGSWRCVFEESKKQHQQSIELQLSLNWVPCSGPLTGSGYQGQEGQDTARELISRIRSVKIRSDSTLSELLVARLDGRCLLVGEFIRVRLQPDRVLKNGRYRFRIGFFTKVIPNSSPLERPLFTNFLDIDAEFSPVRCRPNELPDVTFQFPTSDPPRIIMAHSSAIKTSRYFAHRVAEVVEEKKRRGIPFSGITCEITEFTPAVFRVMLRFLYTGKLRVKSISGGGEERASAGHSSQAKKGPPNKRAFLNKDSRLGGCIQLPEKVYFEDLYRIAERYEIPSLSALSLKGMQCDLNMSIAIAMLVKLPRESVDILGTSCSQAQDYEFKGEIRLDKIQAQLVKSIIKEYIQFYAVEATMLRRPHGETLSVQESLTVIHQIGDCVLDSVEHIWE